MFVCRRLKEKKYVFKLFLISDKSKKPTADQWYATVNILLLLLHCPWMYNVLNQCQSPYSCVSL